MEKGKDFELDVITRLTKIETMLEDFKGIETKAIEAHNLATKNKERLDEIEDTNKWLFRTTVGAVLVGVVGIILSLIK